VSIEVQLAHDLQEVICDSECTWEQAVINLGYVLAVVLLVEDDEEHRAQYAEAVTGRVMAAVQRGSILAETLQ